MSYGQYVSMLNSQQHHKESVEYMLKRKKRRKCKDCDCCRKGYFKSKPNEYVCIGVKNPFMIKDINEPCTEYDLM